MSDEVTNTEVINTEVKSEGANKESQSTENNSEKQEKELKGISKIQANYDKLFEEHKKALKQLDDEKKKSLSQKQIEELERQEKEREMQRMSRELEEKTLIFEKSKLLFEKQWDGEYLDIVSGNDLESFTGNVDKLITKINKLVEKKVNEKLAQGNQTPSAGKTNTEDLFSIDEINSLPKKMGTEWTKNNLEKLNKSIAYWGKQ